MEKKGKWFYASLMFMFLAFSAQAQTKKITAEEYIATYKELAISEMKRTGIPASITLAQGLLESGIGNSELAKQSNNHFGIKCKKDWTGRTVNYDDDAPQECFRAYEKPEDSYIDHSNFLVNGARYASLFELEPTDYKGWAKGLKDAGYATNPKYPELLINSIEKHQLYLYDIGNQRVPKETPENIFASEDKKEINTDIRTYNNIPVYVVKNGDTYDAVAKKNKMMPWQTTKYNDLSKSDKLQPGTILYLKPKRRNAKGHDFHTVQEGESMYYLSQVYGVKLKHLYSKNLMEEGQEPAPGEKINLRKKRKSAPQLVKDNSFANNGKRGITTSTQPQEQIVEKKQTEREKPVVKEENKQKNPVENKEEKPVVQNRENKPKETPKKPEEKPTLYASEEKNTPLTIIEEFNPAAEFHTVKEGETVEKISIKYAAAEKDILLWNEMSDAALYSGQLLRVKPFKNTTTTKVTEKQMPDGNRVLVVETNPKTQEKPKEEIFEPVIETPTVEVPNEEEEDFPLVDKNGYYVVQPGGTVYDISRKLSVPVNKIHEMNKLEDNTVKAGQRIRVKNIGTADKTETRKQPVKIKEEVKIQDVKAPEVEPEMPKTSAQYHEVQAGETLYSISRKYTITVDKLKAMNGLSSNAISLGQKLKIKE